MSRRRGTSTSAFGVGRREGHDAGDFYRRFTPPVTSGDDHVVADTPAELLEVADSRHLPHLSDASVALVVTSPPYFAGKAYEAELSREGVPASYVEYLGVLRDVFAECVAKLEPGGRLAVNVANLGRKPYRSLAADMIGILQDDLGLLLRGEIVWRKGRGAGGSCAWGSFRSPSNPVLRDTTERVVVASKGRFDRARSVERRRTEGLPHRATPSADEFMEATLDVWELAPEQARRVGHPAPFPVELPQRLIGLYTYEGDLVLDPFLGSGSTAVAAVRTARRCAGYDTDPAYVEVARCRVAAEQARMATARPAESLPEGAIGTVAARELRRAGFTDVGPGRTIRGLGLRPDLVATDRHGVRWSVDLTGGFTVAPNGLARTEVAHAAVGRAALLAAAGCSPLLLLSSHLPPPASPLDRQLSSATPALFADALKLLAPGTAERLATLGASSTGR